MELKVKDLENIEEDKSINIIDGCYIYQHNDIFFKCEIETITYVKDDFGDLSYIEVAFENGCVILHADYPVKSIRRPSNCITEFDWCFTIRNNEFEHMGYIAKTRHV